LNTGTKTGLITGSGGERSGGLRQTTEGGRLRASGLRTLGAEPLAGAGAEGLSKKPKKWEGLFRNSTPHPRKKIVSGGGSGAQNGGGTQLLPIFRIFDYAKPISFGPGYSEWLPGSKQSD
jgi:hypothetical protein